MGAKSGLPGPATSTRLPAGRARSYGASWVGGPYLESLFNEEGQQRGGLLVGLLRTIPNRDRDHPLLRSVAGGPFNVNPVFAGYMAGLLALRLAREARESELNETEQAVERIRATLAPLLSGLGDRIVWGGVRPVLSLVGILSAFLWLGEPALWYWLGYNAVRLYWRRRSWSVGLRGEEAVRKEITGPALRRWARIASGTGRFLLGLTLGVVTTGLWLGHGATASGLFVLACLAGFGLARLGRVSPMTLAWLGVGLAGLMALVGFGGRIRP